MEPLGLEALDLGHGGIHVPGGNDAAWDETAWIGVAPFVHVPVIVSLHMANDVGLVGRGTEEQAIKIGQAAEVERGGNAIGIHITDAGVDVVDPGAELVDRGRLHAVFLFRSADDGVERDRRNLHALIVPEIGAIRLGPELWRRGQRITREVTIKQVGWLGDVIVNADEHHVVQLHCIRSSSLGNAASGSESDSVAGLVACVCGSDDR